MTQTISEVFDLPRAEDIQAMGFVVRLREADPASAEVQRLVEDYVITPAVEKELPRILDGMKQVFDRGEEYGRFIHGSFGSGKSHFMTMLALLLESAPAAWAKFRPLMAEHREALAAAGRSGAEHELWLREAGLLVVRIHMLTIRGKHTGFDRAVYEAFNDALKRRGKELFEFLNVDSVFEEVRREAKEYGDIVWKRLEAENIVGGREDFESLAAGSLRARESFARAWLAYKGRDAAEAGIDPRWSEGLRRMAEHARGQGFGGIVLMVDEFLLWLAEKSGQEFIQEINNLNIIVDHNTGQRSLPIFVFVARQRDLREFFPDLVDESKIHEHLEHHAKRFEETRLQDVELRHIVRGRVLRPLDAAAIDKAVAGLAERHQKALPALLGSGGIEYLRDVYPFHPALIEMLVDVTSLMQRERSALRLLYELLVIHYPNLPLGEFLPVGSAFAALFPESGVEASKKVELMQDIHHQYYARLSPAIRRLADEPSLEINSERRLALEQLVKTVLLAEVSPRLKQSGLTIERLVQLNSVDVEGETFRGQVLVAEKDLLALSQAVPDLQVAGQGKTATVRFVLGRVSIGEFLERARSKVDNVTQRFAVFYPALEKALGLDNLKGFGGDPHEGEWEVLWRRTRRRGSIKIGNVREMKNTDFEPPEGAFRILIDYPWDAPGHTVDEDRMRALNVRKKFGLLYTLCWLPRHLSPNELGLLTDLAAVRYLLSAPGQEDLLGTVGPQDRARLLEQAQVRRSTLEGQLDDLLLDVYKRHGELYALISDVDGSRPRETLQENLEHVALLLMDRRYPQHPVFLVEPKRPELELLLDWMVKAGETHVSVPFDEATGKVLKNLGQPLELVNLGQTKASLRLESRYIKDVLQKVDHDTVSWTQVADHLRQTYGFQPLLIDLFLAFLCQRDHRALRQPDGERVEVRLGMPLTIQLELQRGQLLSVADWHRLRELGNQLFGEARPAQRSLQSQDRFAASLREHASTRRRRLQAIHQRLQQLAAGRGRLEEIADANTRLAPLVRTSTDSYEMLEALIQLWPDDAADPLRALVQQVDSLESALDELNMATRSHLEVGRRHESLGLAVADHLARLEQRLGAPQAEQPLSKEWIESWNREAEKLVQQLIERPAPSPAPNTLPASHTLPGTSAGTFAGPGGESVPYMATGPATQPSPRRKVLAAERLDGGNAEQVDRFLGRLRLALAEHGPGLVEVVLNEEEAG